MKIEKPVKAVGGLAASIIIVGLILAGYFVITRYWVLQTRVDAILRALPPAEASPPAIVKEIIQKVDRDVVATWVPRNLIIEVRPERMRMLEWHAQQFVWQLLLPYRINEDQMIALYCHYLSFESGKGLAFGARYYFSKEPGDLNVDEVLGLLTISRSPSRYSPSKHPEKYREKRDELKKKFEAV